jgi:adenosylcobinamide-phosphate synthase
MTLTTQRATSAGLVLGFLADQILADPRRGHPVAGFGRLASRLERRVYRDARGAGVAYALVLVGGPVVLGLAADRLTRDRSALRLLTVGLATWVVLGGRSLAREADTVARQLETADLAAARRQVTHLVGRDPSRLDADELARAAVESVAENSSDAVVAPLWWGAVLGLPGLLGYRAANTLDAMVGHRSRRYGRFGWAAARWDDVVNWAPARLAAGLTALCAPLVGGSVIRTWRTVRSDSHRHPSPNAGVVEAAFAGALAVRLGGTNRYGDRVEDRGFLGTGRPVGVGDISRATRLLGWVSAGALAVSVLIGGRR